MPGRLRRRDPALADLGAGLLPQPGVSRHRGGTCGSDSVNVFRAHRSSRHFQRRLTQQARTRSPARRTSRGRASTVSCRRAETVPQSGHAAAAG